jgi:hypothetical protein
MEQTRETRAGGLGWPQRLFGNYDRRSVEAPDRAPSSRWSRRVSGAKAWTTIIVTLLTVCGTVITKSMDSKPSTQEVVRDTIDERAKVQLAGRVAALESDVAALKAGQDTTRREGRTTLYIACQLLRAAQPGAIPPHECSDDEQRARRVVP